MSDKHPRTKTLVLDFLNNRQASGLSDEAVSWYKRMLDPFCKMCPDLPRRHQQIERYMAAFDAKIQNRFAHYRALHAFYGYLYPDGKPGNPMVHFHFKRPKRKIPYSLTMSELVTLQLIPLSPRDRAFIDLFLDTGVRSSEAIHLAVEDIYQDRIIVDGKTGQREIPISDSVREELQALSKKGLVFTGTKGPLTRSGAYRIIRLAMRKAGIPARKWGPHTLRHTFGRQYIMAGGDLVSLQRILGHTDIATTRIYAELDLRDITIQHNKFSPLVTLAAVMQQREVKVDSGELAGRLKN